MATPLYGPRRARARHELPLSCPAGFARLRLVKGSLTGGMKSIRLELQIVAGEHQGERVRLGFPLKTFHPRCRNSWKAICERDLLEHGAEIDLGELYAALEQFDPVASLRDNRSAEDPFWKPGIHVSGFGKRLRRPR